MLDAVWNGRTAAALGVAAFATVHALLLASCAPPKWLDTNTVSLSGCGASDQAGLEYLALDLESPTAFVSMVVQGDVLGLPAAKDWVSIVDLPRPAVAIRVLRLDVEGAVEEAETCTMGIDNRVLTGEAWTLEEGTLTLRADHRVSIQGGGACESHDYALTVQLQDAVLRRGDRLERVDTWTPVTGEVMVLHLPQRHAAALWSCTQWWRSDSDIVAFPLPLPP